MREYQGWVIAGLALLALWAVLLLYSTHYHDGRYADGPGEGMQNGMPFFFLLAFSAAFLFAAGVRLLLLLFMWLLDFVHNTWPPQSN